jgi:hypothetical protein
LAPAYETANAQLSVKSAHAIWASRRENVDGFYSPSHCLYRADHKLGTATLAPLARGFNEIPAVLLMAGKETLEILLIRTPQ